MKRLAWLLVMCAALTGCAALSGWLDEPVTAGPAPGSVTTPGGGTYTPPPAPTGPVTVPTPGGGELVYTPAPVTPIVTKGDVVKQTGTGLAVAAFGPLGGAVASVLFGLLGKKAA